MDIVIDFMPLIAAADQGPIYFFWFFLINGGWAVMTVIFLSVLIKVWHIGKRQKFLAAQKYTLLAIDVPKDSEQTLKAVEQIFSALHSTRSRGTKYERMFKGKVPLGFSFEIVSIEGYIQFLIRTPEKFRDLIEAAVYAQYPEAEITEVEDYVSMIPPDIGTLNCEYNLFGAEFTLKKPDAYPLKVYTQFEHTMSQIFVDPMANVLEAFSKLRKGEQAAYQLVVRPTADSWKDQGERIVKKLIGAKMEAKKGPTDKLAEGILSFLNSIATTFFTIFAEIPEEKKRDEVPSKMQYLSPGEKTVVEAIENKISKLGYKCKLRTYYLAHKSIYTVPRGIAVALSSMKQFDVLNMNQLTAVKKAFTIADYFFIERRLARKRHFLVKGFRERNTLKYGRPFILNTEELATLYHFPTIGVKTTLVKTIDSKKGEAPVSTPFEASGADEFFQSRAPAPSKGEENKEEKVEYLPPELQNYNFNNKFYEDRYSVDEKKTVKLEQKKEPEKSDDVPPNLPFA